MEILNTTPLTKTNAVKGGNLTPLKKYEPEKLVMPRLPKFMIPKFATSEGGATDTMSEYVYKLSENYAQYVPRGYGYVACYPYNLDKEESAPVKLRLIGNFFSLLEAGQISLIYKKINQHFSTPEWALKKDFSAVDYLKNKTVIIDIISSVVTSENTPYLTTETINLVCDFIYKPQELVVSLYNAVVEYVSSKQEWIKTRIDEANYRNEYNKKIAQSVWDPSGLSALILRNKYKRLVTEYFNQYFSLPNTSIYNSAKAFNDSLASFNQFFNDNYLKATGDDKSFEFDELSLSSSQYMTSGKISSLWRENIQKKNENGTSVNSDKTMIVVALCFLAGLFILKRCRQR